MTSTAAANAATFSILTADQVRPGDIVVSFTLTGGVARQRVTEVSNLKVTITDPAKRTRTTYPCVRLHFGGMSLDYAPDSPVNVA